MTDSTSSQVIAIYPIFRAVRSSGVRVSFEDLIAAESMLRDVGDEIGQEDLPVILSLLWGKTSSDQTKVLQSSVFFLDQLLGVLNATPVIPEMTDPVVQTKEAANHTMQRAMGAMERFDQLTRRVQTVLLQALAILLVVLLGSFIWTQGRAILTSVRHNSQDSLPFYWLSLLSLLIPASLVGLALTKFANMRWIRHRETNRIGTPLGVRAKRGREESFDRTSRRVLAALLRRNSRVEARTDCKQTIRQTIRHWPDVRIETSRLPVTRSLTVVIERRSLFDCHASLWEKLFLDMHQRGIRCDVYRFTDSLDWIISATNGVPGIPITDLAPVDSRSDLVIIADPSNLNQLRDRVPGESLAKLFAAWDDCILLTPFADQSLAPIPHEIKKWFRLGEATPDGLVSVLGHEAEAENFARLDDHKLAHIPPEDVSLVLEESLGKSAVNLLRASAVFPQISPPILSHFLDSNLIPRTLHWSNAIFRLASLRWFREGFLPNHLRRALMQEMDTEAIRATRLVLDDLWGVAHGIRSQSGDETLSVSGGGNTAFSTMADALTVDFLVRASALDYKVTSGLAEELEQRQRRRLRFAATMITFSLIAFFALWVGTRLLDPNPTFVRATIGAVSLLAISYLLRRQILSHAMSLREQAGRVVFRFLNGAREVAHYDDLADSPSDLPTSPEVRLIASVRSFFGESKPVFVIGARHVLGPQLIHALLQEGTKVIAVDVDDDGGLEHLKAEMIGKLDSDCSSRLEFMALPWSGSDYRHASRTLHASIRSRTFFAGATHIYLGLARTQRLRMAIQIDHRRPFVLGRFDLDSGIVLGTYVMGRARMLEGLVMTIPYSDIGAAFARHLFIIYYFFPFVAYVRALSGKPVFSCRQTFLLLSSIVARGAEPSSSPKTYFEAISLRNRVKSTASQHESYDVRPLMPIDQIVGAIVLAFRHIKHRRVRVAKVISSAVIDTRDFMGGHMRPVIRNPFLRLMWRLAPIHEFGPMESETPPESSRQKFLIDLSADEVTLEEIHNLP